MAETIRPSSMTLVRAAVLVVVASFAVLLLTLRWLVPDVGFSWETRELGGHFTLRSAEGPVSTEDFAGKVVLLYFGYTMCPDVCPTTLSDVGGAISTLEEAERAHVAGLFVSIDPERDTLERLREYTGYFSPQIVGVTGSEEELRDAIELYGGSFAKRAMPEGEGYSMDHPGSTYILDPRGQLYAIAKHGTSIKGLVKLIRNALAGKPSPAANGELVCDDCL